MKSAFVTPISNKAKNRFANLMDSKGECIIEQQNNGWLFLTSQNRKYHFWVSATHDQHWNVKIN